MALETEERWQTRIRNVSEGIRHIHDYGEFTDVKIRVRGKEFDAHRLILASRSSEFARLLMSPNSPDEIVVDRASPVTPAGFCVLRNFIYKNEFNTTDKKSIIEGYLAAKYFKQKAMQIKCMEEIECWTIKDDEVCDLLDIECDIPGLKDKCISYVRDNAVAIISSESFIKASFKSLSTILSSGVLEAVPVLQRIEYIMKWGKNLYPSAPDYSLVRQQLLDTTPPLLGMLEFEKLGPDEIGEIYSTYTGLLTDADAPKFFKYIGKKDPAFLPEWCCMARRMMQ